MQFSKKITILLTTAGLISLSHLPALAGSHGGRCLNTQKGRTENCRINVTANNLALTFNNSELQSENLTIPVNRIRNISTGEFAQRRIKESIAAGLILGPIGGIVGLLRRQQRTQIAIEFTNSAGQLQVTMIDLPSRYSPPLVADLERTTGIMVQGQDSK